MQNSVEVLLFGTLFLSGAISHCVIVQGRLRCIHGLAAVYTATCLVTYSHVLTAPLFIPQF